MKTQSNWNIFLDTKGFGNMKNKNNNIKKSMSSTAPMYQQNPIIKEIKQRIVQSLFPEKIILFGSYAYGKPDKYSDIDILIITNKNLPKKGRSIIAENLMSGILIPTDFLIYTSEEVNKLRTVKSHIVYEIMKKGRVIYGR